MFFFFLEVKDETLPSTTASVLQQHVTEALLFFVFLFFFLSLSLLSPLCLHVFTHTHTREDAHTNADIEGTYFSFFSKLVRVCHLRCLGSNLRLFFFPCTPLRCMATLLGCFGVSLTAPTCLVSAHGARCSSIGRTSQKLCCVPFGCPVVSGWTSPCCSAQCGEWRRKCATPSCRTHHPTLMMAFKSAPYQPAPPPRQRRGDSAGQGRSGMSN